MEQFLIQRLIRLLRAHRQENIASDELVDHLTVRRQAAEDYVALLKLDHHVFHFPVDVPRLKMTKLSFQYEDNISKFFMMSLLCHLQQLRWRHFLQDKRKTCKANQLYLHCVVSPRLQVVASIYVHFHNPVVRDAEQLVFFVSHEPNDEQ